MNYLISRVTLPNGICNLGAIKNVPEWAKIMHGIPQEGKFPTEAQFQMDPDRRKDTKLADVLENTNRLLVVSERLKDLLATWNSLKQNEVFEVGILNHKGKPEKAKYFLIHQINHPKCVNETETVGTKSAIDSSQYLAITKLVLDESKIDPGVAIFRPAEFHNRPFFRKDIVEKILAAGITGIKFYELETIQNYTPF